MAKPKKPLPAAPRRPPPLAVPADVAAQFVATGDVPGSPQTSSDAPKKTSADVHSPQGAGASNGASVDVYGLSKTPADVHTVVPLVSGSSERLATLGRTPRDRLVARQTGERARRTVYLSPTTDAALEDHCRVEGREVSWVVEQAVRRFLSL